MLTGGTRPTRTWSVSSITSRTSAIRRNRGIQALTVSTCRARILLTVLTVLRSTVVPRHRTVSRNRLFLSAIYLARDYRHSLLRELFGKIAAGRNEHSSACTINVSPFVFLEEYLRKAAPYVEGGYNDIDPGLNPALQDHYRITPSPGGPGDQYGTFGIETGGGYARFFFPPPLDFSLLFARFIL